MTTSDARNALQPGNKMLWYRIDRILGQGGFGITYLAHDTNLDQQVAIKEYLPVELAVRDGDSSIHPVSSSQVERYQWGLERFIAEARTLARFKHPSIVQVSAVFEANNTAYMVMEYEHGTTLQEVLGRNRTLPEEELVRLLVALMSGLEVLHAGGFIHRDIKPANIFVRHQGPALLIDFGSARQAMGNRALTTIVSPGYAPFEQYFSNSTRQGPWTDIYSLAATMYRAIAGRAPLDAVDRSAAILGTERDIFVPAVEVGRGRYSERFLQAIDAALKFRENERPQTVAEWRALFAFSPAGSTPSAAVSRPAAVPEPAANERTIALSTRVTEPEFTTPIRVDPGLRSSRPAATAAAGWRFGRGATLALIAFAGVVIVVGALWLAGAARWRQAPATVVAALAGLWSDPAADTARTLAAAEVARRDGRLVGSDPGSALSLYREVLARSPDDRAARAGLTALAGQLLEDARAALGAADEAAVERLLNEVGGFAAETADPAALAADIEALSQRLAERRATQRQIDETLRAARADLAAGRYGGPGEDNALARLRGLLALAPDDQGLREAVSTIVAELTAAGRASLASNQFELARQQLELVQGLAADTEATGALRAAIDEAEALHTTAQERNATIERTLAQAAADLAAFRLTGPARGNAHQRYREVLELDPDHATARRGLEQIVDTYLELAREASGEDDPEQARVYLQRARTVAPTDARLAKALRESGEE